MYEFNSGEKLTNLIKAEIINRLNDISDAETSDSEVDQLEVNDSNKSLKIEETIEKKRTITEEVKFSSIVSNII